VSLAQTTTLEVFEEVEPGPNCEDTIRFGNYARIVPDDDPGPNCEDKIRFGDHAREVKQSTE